MNVRELLINAATSKPKRRQREPTMEADENSGDTHQQMDGETTHTVESQQRVEFEIGNSRQGGEVLWYEGFRFLFNKKTGDRAYWRLTPPSISGVEVEERLRNFNKRARTEPNWAAKRRRPFGHALNGNEVANIAIPPELRTKDNKSFLIYDSASVRPGADDRTILFASDKALSFLRHNRNCSSAAHFVAALVWHFCRQKLFGFLFYMAKNYIGLSEWERTNKAASFQSDSDANRMFDDMAGHSTPRTSMTMPNPNDVRSLILTSFCRHSDEFSIVHPQPAGETSLNINHIGL
uniref:Uncharacterized protein n=1 Tax=Globodera rostochiensis TaxID=31243 RepID=A0A914HTH1_GLORO